MGAWGMGPFENDSAFDWLFELEEGGLDAIAEAFAVHDSDYLEVDEGAAVIAAAEVLSALLGEPHVGGLPEQVSGWLETHGPVRGAELADVLVAQALAALERVMGEDSEVYELWEETEDFDVWREGVEALRGRLERGLEAS